MEPTQTETRQPEIPCIKDTYLVTGTVHGAYIHATSQGEARRMFHEYYKGESIIHMEKRKGIIYP